MKKRFIAVIDSGIGGLSLLKELVKAMPNEQFLYYGDNRNAPYGNKTKRELLSLVIDVILSVKRYNVKAIVFGCNTISLTILDEVSKIFNDIKFFGVFPPVESHILSNKSVLLLCTENSARHYKQSQNLTILPLSNLAKDIENNAINLDNIDIKKHVERAIISNSFILNEELTTEQSFLTTKKLQTLFDHPKGAFEVVVLGCTHYFFVKNKIFNHFQPQEIFGGEKLTSKMVKEFLVNSKSLEKHLQNTILFIGENAKNNKFIYENILGNLSF